MGWIEGIITSVVATIVVAGALAGYRRWFGQRIKITEPQENGFLAPPETRHGIQAYLVSGTLKRLPRDCMIWLIVVDEAKGRFWPQGFEPVDYQANTGTWTGYVNAFGWHRIKIVAVIVPPTSQEYFNYFQRVGQKTGHEPLLGIPPECKKHDSVHAKVLPPPLAPAP